MTLESCVGCEGGGTFPNVMEERLSFRVVRMCAKEITHVGVPDTLVHREKGSISVVVDGMRLAALNWHLYPKKFAAHSWHVRKLRKIPCDHSQSSIQQSRS